jgi:hypothetical protein
MSEDLRSTVELRSNIYVVENAEIRKDERFLHVVRDPAALRHIEKDREAYRLLTARQKEISKDSHDLSCSLLHDRENLCFGTVIRNGNEVEACRCEKFDCERFLKCRPGFVVPETYEDDERYENLLVEKDADDSKEDVQATAEENFVFGGFSEDDATAAISPYQMNMFDLDEDLNDSDEDDYEDFVVDPNQVTLDFVIDEIDDAVERIEIQDMPAESDDDSSVRTYPYDEQQAKVIRADVSSRIMVNAGPGTGKTFSLVERIKYLLNETDVDPSAIIVFSYTRSAVHVVQERLAEAAHRGEIDGVWQDVTVTTIDSFATQILNYVIETEEKSSLEAHKLKSGGYDDRIRNAVNQLQSHEDLVSSCVHLIFDETQDLIGPRARFALAMIHCIPSDAGVTLFGDRCQALYDYQCRDGGMTSEEFYDQICAMDDFVFESFNKNYRSGDDSPIDLSEMRSGILSRNNEAGLKGLYVACKSVATDERLISQLNNDELDSLSKCATTGILTRTNAQALDICSSLLQHNVPYTYLRSERTNFASRLFADILIGYENETIKRDVFIERGAIAGHDESELELVWRELSQLKGACFEGGNLVIESLLESLAGSEPPSSMAAQKSKSCSVSVSTIHAAKGSEYDSVWLLGEDLCKLDKLEDGSAYLDELKVAYVALSRTRVNACIYNYDSGKRSVVAQPDVSRKSRHKDSGRCFQAPKGNSKRRGRKSKYLYKIEILSDKDLDFSSMCTDYVQKAIKKDELLNKDLIFRLDDDSADEFGPYAYKIMPEGDTDMCIGKTSRGFKDGYFECCQYNYASDVNVKLPEGFDEMRVDKIISCVGKNPNDPSCATKFGKYSIWYGFTVSGFAHRASSSDY